MAKKASTSRYGIKGEKLKVGESYNKALGLYVYRWTDKFGERHQISRKKLTDLREQEKKIERDLADGIRMGEQNITLNDVFEVWVKDKVGLKDNTKSNYVYMYRHFVQNTFGTLRIQEIRKSDVRRFYNTIIGEGRNKVLVSTLESIHTVLHQVFNLAVEDNYIRMNPSDGVLGECKRANNIEVPKRHALTIPEQTAFINYVKHTNKYELILELPSESVQSLSWEYNGETLSFHKDHKDETWFYDGDENFPVSQEKINALLEQFQSFGAAFIIEDVEDFGQYGLNTPVCTINLSAAEQTYEVKLGDYSKMDLQRYVSIGDGNVYLVKHDLLDEYDAVLSDMIDHDEIPSFSHVTQIQFAGAEAYSITYQENSVDTYCDDDVYFTHQGGRDLPLDTSKVDSYLRSIANLNPVNYVSYHVTDEELQTYGLDAPQLTITVDYTAEGDNGGEAADTFVLYVSPDPEDVKAAEEAEDGDQEAEISAYIRVGESQIVYRISSSSYKKLAGASYNDLRHAEVIWADFSDVQQIDISLEGNSYTLTSEKDGDERAWSYQDKNDLEIADFQFALEALIADAFTDEQPTQKEEIGLTIHLDNENFPQVQIELYRYDGSRCLAAVDGESVSLVERTAVVDLIEAIYAIVLD